MCEMGVIVREIRQICQNIAFFPKIRMNLHTCKKNIPEIKELICDIFSSGKINACLVKNKLTPANNCKQQRFMSFTLLGLQCALPTPVLRTPEAHIDQGSLWWPTPYSWGAKTPKSFQRWLPRKIQRNFLYVRTGNGNSLFFECLLYCTFLSRKSIN